MNINRRHFLFGSAAALTLAGCSTQRAGLRPLRPGERRKVALIGYGIQMRGTLAPSFLGQLPGTEAVRQMVEIVAVCDCDRARREAGAQAVNAAYGTANCRAVADFRDVLADPEIDIVCIATPDHWHAYLCVEAMKRGKDVYCEKPLTFNVDEA